MLSRLFTLSEPDAPPAHVVGNKFARLHQAIEIAPVPAAWCIPVDWLAEALGPRRLTQLDDLFAGLRATVGHDLTGVEFRLAAILDGLELTAPMHAALAATVDLTSGQYAVRSSSTVEDGLHHSHAGLYSSYLHVEGPVQAAAAVVACWRSFYSLRAVVGRLRAGDIDPAPRMAVIIQTMVDASLAGVAFTQGDLVLIEAANGTGDVVVSGEATVQRSQYPIQAAAPAPYDRVIALAVTTRAHIGAEADIEWAYDGATVHLLQTRPVTAAAITRHATRRAVFTWDNLYFSEALPRGFTLGSCGEIYHAMTTKRSRLYRLARYHGLRVDDGWIVTCNGAGLDDPTIHPAWWATLDGEVVVDLGTTARQNIMPARQLPGFLTQVLNAEHDRYACHTVIVRRFGRGDAGAVTRMMPDGTIAMEHSPDGLLAINRGLTAPDPLELPRPSHADAWRSLHAPQAWTANALRQVAEFTTLASDLYPDAYLEWIITGGWPQFVDYSTPAGGRTHLDMAANATLISPGAARGPVLVIPDSADLTELSIAPIVSVNANAPVPASHLITRLLDEIATMPAPPVILARRPYAILSLLIGHVAGFVFTGGSTLCHLAILLREADVPAVVTHEPLPADGQLFVTIDNGSLYVMTTG